MKNTAILIFLMLIGVAALDLLPAIEQAQSYVSLENYENLKASCQNILAERPWYGKLNYWFFTWIIFVPAFIFSISPNASAWIRGSRVIIAAGVCYVLMNLAVHLQWDIRNAPFQEDPFNPDPLNGWRMDCANDAGDGFSYVTALMSAWIPACIYTGLCLLSWRFYHNQFSKETMENYKSDPITLILFWGLRIYFIIFLLYLSLVVASIAYGYFAKDFLIHPPIMSFIGMIVLRPLNIPFEIFLY